MSCFRNDNLYGLSENIHIFFYISGAKLNAETGDLTDEACHVISRQERRKDKLGKAMTSNSN